MSLSILNLIFCLIDIFPSAHLHQLLVQERQFDNHPHLRPRCRGCH